jgi:hypothetical protein
MKRNVKMRTAKGIFLTPCQALQLQRWIGTAAHTQLLGWSELSLSLSRTMKIAISSSASRVALPRSLDRVSSLSFPRAAAAAVWMIPSVSSDDDEDDPDYMEDNDTLSRRRRSSRHLQKRTAATSTSNSTAAAAFTNLVTASKSSSVPPCPPHFDDNSLNCNDSAAATRPIARGGVACPFPWKLHDMLEYCCSDNGDCDSTVRCDYHNIVTWNDEGTAFGVVDTPRFVKTILPL